MFTYILTNFIKLSSNYDDSNGKSLLYCFYFLGSLPINKLFKGKSFLFKILSIILFSKETKSDNSYIYEFYSANNVVNVDN